MVVLTNNKTYFQKLKEDRLQQRTTTLNEISRQIETYERTQEEQLDKILQTKQYKHSCEQQYYVQMLKKQQETSEFIRNNAVSRELKIQHMLLTKKKLVETFRGFAQSTGMKIDRKTDELLCSHTVVT